MRNQGFWQLLQAYSSYRQWSLDFRSALSIDQDRSRPIDGHSGCTQVFECALSKVRSASQITTVIARFSRAHSKSWVHTRPIFMAGDLLIPCRERGNKTAPSFGRFTGENQDTQPVIWVSERLKSHGGDDGAASLIPKDRSWEKL